MYDVSVQDAIVKAAKLEQLSKTDIEILDSTLLPEEQQNVITFCSALLAETNIEDIIDCAGYLEDHFCEAYHVDENTFARWRTEGLTPFEHYVVVYMLCANEVTCDRIQFCPTCGKMFSAYIPGGGVCSDCRAEMLLRMDKFFRDHYIY